MAADDRVDVGVDAVDDPAEGARRVGGGRQAGRGRALVDEQHDEVGAGRGEGVGLGVDRRHDVVDRDVGDAARRDQARQLLGHGADEADLDAPRRSRGPGLGRPRGRCRTSCAGWRRRTATARRRRGSSSASYGAITRLTRSSYPWSSSWLPTADTSRPASLSASMVGLSCWMNDSNVEAPIRSPAAANTVFGLLAAQSVDHAGQLGRAGLAPVGLSSMPAVEVVDAQDLDVDGRRGWPPVRSRPPASSRRAPRRRRPQRRAPAPGGRAGPGSQDDEPPRVGVPDAALMTPARRCGHPNPAR